MEYYSTVLYPQIVAEILLMLLLHEAKRLECLLESNHCGSFIVKHYQAVRSSVTYPPAWLCPQTSVSAACCIN